MEERPKTINGSKLIAFLGILTVPEMNRLDKFVVSPFFNDKKEVITLFKYLKRLHPTFEKDIYRRQIYNHLYPQNTCAKNQPLDGRRDDELRSMMFQLTKLVKQFLLYEARNKNEVRSEQQFAEILRTRGLIKYIPSIIKKAKNIQAKRPEGDAMYLHDKYLIAEVEHNYIRSAGRQKDRDYQPIITGFHYHALAGRLRVYAAALSAEKTLHKSYDYPMLSYLLDYLAKRDYAHVPIIDIYYRFCMLFRDKDVTTHYKRACEILENNKEYFPPSELQYLYDLLFSFCNLQINKGYLDYNQQKFDIYQRTLPDNIWNEGKYLLRDHFILAVRSALGIGNIVGAREIIDIYGKELHPEQKKGIILLADVFLYLAERKYEEAENTLIEMRSPPPGFYYGLYYRWIATQIYYELSIIKDRKYLKMFENEANNMGAYLRNARMSKRNKELYTNYLRIIVRIFNMRFKKVNVPPIKRLENIKTDIKNPDKPLVSRKWLFEKIEEVIAYWEKKR